MLAFRLLPLSIGVMTTAAALVGCNNPETASKQLFTNMGLSLLQPERSYIAPGGIVVLTQGGLPMYMDPLDNPNPTGNSEDNTNEVDFQAVFASVAKSDHTGLQLAVQLVSTVLPASGGLQVGSDSQVTLDQINASGRRMLSGALQSFINAGSTAAELKAQLSSGNNARAFVVQEVYQSTSMSIKSTTNTSIDVSLTSGQPVPACTSSPSASTTNSTSSSGSPGSTAPASNPASTANTNAATSSGSNANSSNADGSRGTTTQPAAHNAAQPTAASRAGGSLAICLGPHNYSLSFTSNSPIPFAVRLVEVRSTGGTLAILTNGKPLPGAMGGGIGEMSAVIGGGSAQTLMKVCPKTLTRDKCTARAHHGFT